MTAYLKPGDRITLAAPDFLPNAPIAADIQMWRDIYGPLGIDVEHVSVHQGLTHPVVVAVIRDEA